MCIRDSYFVDYDAGSREHYLTRLPYLSCLQHTTEDIRKSLREDSSRDRILGDLSKAIQGRLGVTSVASKSHNIQRKTLSSFIQDTKQHNGFVFLAMHGGDGENGVFQRRLEDGNVAFNGSGSIASALCSDKILTNEKIDSLELDGVTTACLLYTSPSPRDATLSRMPSSA